MAGEIQSRPVIVTPSPEGEGPNLLDYVGALRRRTKTIVIPGILLALVGAAVAFVVPPQYEASTKFKVEDPGLLSGIVGFGGVSVPHKPLLARAESEIKSPRFLRPIIARIGINEGYNVTRPDEYQKLLDYIYKNLRITIDSAQRGPDLFEISYKGRNQSKVVQFVDAVREGYADYFRDIYREPSREYYNQAQALVSDLERKVTERTALRDAYLSNTDLGLLGQGSALGRELEQLREVLSAKERTRDSIITKEQKAVVQLRTIPKERRTRRVVESEDYKTARQNLALAEADLNYKIDVQGLTDLTPEVQTARRRVEELRAKLSALDPTVEIPDAVEPNDSYQSLESEILAYRRELEGLQKEIANVRRRIRKIEADLEEIPRLEGRMSALTEDLALARKSLGEAVGKMSRVRDNWNRVRDFNFFRVLELPNGNEPPVFPSPPIFILVGAVVGLLAGVGLAFLKEFSGMTYATTAQVKAVITVPILGEVSPIVSAEERRKERARRTRRLLIAAAVFGAIGVLHLFYFDEELSKHLPSQVVQAMDKIYLGR